MIHTDPNIPQMLNHASSEGMDSYSVVGHPVRKKVTLLVPNKLVRPYLMY